MGLLDSLEQGLSAAGYGAADLFAKQALMEQQAANDMQRLERSDVLETERQKRLAEFQNDLKNAPLKRFGELVKSESGVEVEKTAPDLRALTGYNPAAAESGPSQPGFTGDIAATKAAIAKLPEADRIKAEAQLAGQIEADQKLNGLLNSGMRKRTAEESVAAASKRALTNDPEAYAAYEERIGKPLREERKSDRADRAAELAMQRADASALAAERRDATQRYIAELRSEDANKRLEALIGRSGSGGGTTEDRERRLALHELVGSMQKQLDQARQGLKDDPENAAQYRDRIKELQPRLNTYLKELERGLGIAEPERKPVGDWNNETGAVTYNGKVIGNAKTKDDAVTLLRAAVSDKPAESQKKQTGKSETSAVLDAGEQNFAKLAAKDGWEHYSSDYGITLFGKKAHAYRKKGSDGEWIVKTGEELARELGVVY